MSPFTFTFVYRHLFTPSIVAKLPQWDHFHDHKLISDGLWIKQFLSHTMHRDHILLLKLFFCRKQLPLHAQQCQDWSDNKQRWSASPQYEAADGYTSLTFQPPPDLVSPFGSIARPLSHLKKAPKSHLHNGNQHSRIWGTSLVDCLSSPESGARFDWPAVSGLPLYPASNRQLQKSCHWLPVQWLVPNCGRSPRRTHRIHLFGIRSLIPVPQCRHLRLMCQRYCRCYSCVSVREYAYKLSLIWASSLKDTPLSLFDRISY